MFVSFLLCTFSPTFHTVLFGRKSLCSSHLRSGELCTTSLNVNMSKKKFGILHRRFDSSPSFIYVTIYLYQYGLTFTLYLGGYNPVQFYFVCSNCSSFGHSMLFWVEAQVLLTYPRHFFFFSIYLFAGTTRCFRLILYMFGPLL